MHRTQVRVVEDALDAKNTIASANRGGCDRAAVSAKTGAGVDTFHGWLTTLPARAAAPA